MSHSNISIFIPHLGCPHQCSFCNQKHITGQNLMPEEKDVDSAVKIAMSSPNYNSNRTEIALFGGSFTAIDRDYMTKMLSVACKYVEKGIVSGIRISTRPDCIDREILNILKSYKVSAIELGAQSMIDTVLSLNQRGHTAQDVVNASRLIKEFGFELGLQMMTGLYGSDAEIDKNTAEKIIEIKPDTVRIYPTIILKNTNLGNLYLNGTYKPQTLEETVDICTSLLKMFEKADIKVIRLGLHSIENDAYLAGPWHPALKELCDNKRYRDNLDKCIQKKGNYDIFVAKNDVSKATGQKKSNINYFKNKGINIRILPDEKLNSYEFVIKEVK